MVPLLSSSKKEVPELWSRTLPKQEGFLRKGQLSLLQLAQTQMTNSIDPHPHSLNMLSVQSLEQVIVTFC